MKKRILVFAAMFFVMLGIAFAPAKTTEARSIKNVKTLTGKFYSVKNRTRIKVVKGKVRINSYLGEYVRNDGKDEREGKVKRTFKTAKNVKYLYGWEVNELNTNHKISRKAFVKRYKEKEFGSIAYTFKNGKITKIKIVYD